ncbi:uncharacterized protein LOC122507394 [Leptopilina heterotoma]|uniref:uncharacterized protein LOC122507394 n=1 Tax=Leptopilina heterotoma TaxID=63436 RepID=UPI001CA8EE8A|nr:uncharacterized protein LOC122507394 [Leptopilina heterotoma]
MSNLMHWIVRTCGIFISMALLLINSEKIVSHVGLNISAINSKILICILYLGFFASCAASIVLYRVFTFNNCEAASLELKKQTEDAKSDLLRKGIKLKEN